MSSEQRMNVLFELDSKVKLAFHTITSRCSPSTPAGPVMATASEAMEAVRGRGRGNERGRGSASANVPGTARAIVTGNGQTGNGRERGRETEGTGTGMRGEHDGG